VNGSRNSAAPSPDGSVRRGTRPAILLGAACIIAAASVVAGLALGSFPLSLADVVATLTNPADGLAGEIVMRVRLPRVLAAFACGGLLALAGLLLQVLLRNPLADPYVLGISGGAGLGVLAATLLGASYAGTHAAGLAGALTVIVVVFGLGYRTGDLHLYRLLLTGVVVSAGCGAAIGLLLTLAPQGTVKGTLFWLMGDLSAADDARGAWAALLLLGGLAWAMGGALNVLSLGRMKAASLGVSVTAAEMLVYFAASIATVAAVALGGTIGFVGLIVPHLIRLLGVTDLRWLVPLSLLTGGALLSLADTAARWAFAPLQIPVGVLTALIGVPVMLVLLWRRA